jgi:hypothetical protein
MLMPSLTPMVLKRIPTNPAADTPSFTFTPKSSKCILQVLPSYQTLAIPTCALSISSRVMPVPYSIACEAPCERGCVIRELYLFNCSAIFSFLLQKLTKKTPDEFSDW